MLTDTAAPEEVPVQLDAIAARSLDPNDDPAPARMVLASPFMHHYSSRRCAAGDAPPPWWRSSACVGAAGFAEGYPTTWENWNVDFPDGSQCHAFSAHPRYHLALALEALA